MTTTIETTEGLSDPDQAVGCRVAQETRPTLLRGSLDYFQAVTNNKMTRPWAK